MFFCALQTDRKTVGWTDGWTDVWTKSLSKKSISQSDKGFACQRSIITSLSSSSSTTDATITFYFLTINQFFNEPKQTNMFPQHLGTRSYCSKFVRLADKECVAKTKKNKAGYTAIQLRTVGQEQ